MQSSVSVQFRAPASCLKSREHHRLRQQTLRMALLPATVIGMAVLAIETADNDAQMRALSVDRPRLARQAQLLPALAQWQAQPQPGGLNAGPPQRTRADSPSTPIEVYRATCLQCHGNDGRGADVRESLPQIPDFTDPTWQGARADAQLSNSILNGKGKAMRPMAKKLGSVPVDQMVAFIRAFRGGRQVVPDEADEDPPVAAPAARNPEPLRPAIPPSAPPMSRSVQDGSRLFQRFCIRCHGADGTGSVMREDLPAIPNFTDPGWHGRHSDSQLVASILHGKGTQMPAFQGRISSREAHDLVASLRAFSPTRPQLVESGPADFEARFRELERQFRDLERQQYEITHPRRQP